MGRKLPPSLSAKPIPKTENVTSSTNIHTITSVALDNCNTSAYKDVPCFLMHYKDECSPCLNDSQYLCLCSFQFPTPL